MTIPNGITIECILYNDHYNILDILIISLRIYNYIFINTGNNELLLKLMKYFVNT